MATLVLYFSEHDRKTVGRPPSMESSQRVRHGLLHRQLAMPQRQTCLSWAKEPTLNWLPGALTESDTKHGGVTLIRQQRRGSAAASAATAPTGTDPRGPEKAS